MGERAILAVLVYAQKPDYRSEQDNRRFDKEVSLLAHPRFVKVEHYGIGTFVCVRYVGHELRSNGIATV